MSSSTTDSYILPSSQSHDTNSDSGSDVDSLPSSLDSSDLDSVSNSDAQREWEASLEQLELVLTMVIVPYAGKYFGRKFAYWSELPIYLHLAKREKGRGSSWRDVRVRTMGIGDRERWECANGSM